jgi:predicted CoA-substrate-specific enzyme activase
MIAAGLDIGSVAAKAVLWDAEAERVVARAQEPTGWEPGRAGRRVLEEALREAGLGERALGGLVVTGYGRTLWRGPGRAVTEITCLASGARQALPSARTVFDVGGQDSKVLSMDAEGGVLGFAVNDRCAAGTGRFLEVTGQRLGLEVGELGVAALAATEGVRLSSLCAVFAESEVVGLLAAGTDRERVARGLCEGVAQQLLQLASGVGPVGPLGLVGGVARNRGVVTALERLTTETVLVPDQPHFVVAWGAAVIAATEGRV